MPSHPPAQGKRPGSRTRAAEPHSNHPQPPPQPPATQNHEFDGIGFGEIDSANPVVGDMLYRLDDNRSDLKKTVLGAPPSAPVPGAAPPASSQDEGYEGAAADADAGSGAQEPEVIEVEDHLAWLRNLPWWKTPSQWWLIPMAFALAVATGATVPPKVELYTQLICEEMHANQASPTGRFFRLPHERPPMGSECRADPDVVSNSAALSMRITIAMGLLSAFTTGWWGGLSDRRGRTKVLACAMGGILVADFSFLAVGLLPITSLPLGTNFMLLSSGLEGLLGGFATLVAAHQAYVSDCTPAGTRATIYAQLTGAFYGGFAVGPALGGWMVRASDSLLSAFILATCVHGLYLFGMLFVIPESTSPQRRREAMSDHEKQTASASESESEEQALKTRAGALISRMLKPLEPLTMLFPRQVDHVERSQSRPVSAMPSMSDLRHGSELPAMDPSASTSHISMSHISRARKRDWNLFWLSAAYGLDMACAGILPVKSLYAEEVFLWGPSELGVFMTGIAITRVLSLTVVLPVFIKFWHRPPKAVSLPQDSGNDEASGWLLDDEGRPSTGRKAGYGATDNDLCRPLDSGRSRSPDSYEGTGSEEGLMEGEQEASIEELWTLRAKHLRLLHDSHFDLKIARISLVICALAYAFLAVFRGPFTFCAATALTSLGSGAGASMSSLALAVLRKPTEAGRLFGAWAILSAIASTVVGPFVFTAVFRAFAHSAPHAIFWAGLVAFLGSFLCLCCIRLRKPNSLPALPPRPRTRGLSGEGGLSADDAALGGPFRRSSFMEEDGDGAGGERRPQPDGQDRFARHQGSTRSQIRMLTAQRGADQGGANEGASKSRPSGPFGPGPGHSATSGQ